MSRFLKWVILRPWVFHRLQDYCRWKSWDINKFPDQKHWDLMSFKCNLLGFILGSCKCPSCNKVDNLFVREDYDALTIYCRNCTAEYYQCAGFAQEPFNCHAAAVIKPGNLCTQD